MPVEVSDTTSRTRSVTATGIQFITVESILAFADELRAQQIPPRERIDCEHAHDTRHLIRLSVRVSEKWDTPSGAVVEAVIHAAGCESGTCGGECDG
jgi:hypothetical protein